jgi:hypothetical protein
MPANLFHSGAAAACSHGGQVTTVTTQSRVFVSGAPVATMKDLFTIAGCGFNVAGGPHPCVKVRWSKPARRVFVDGQPVILAPSVALCEAADLAPQGAPIVMKVQTRVVGS